MAATPPGDPLNQRIDTLGLCWLELSGCCWQTVMLPLPLLVQRRYGALLLREVVPRLRCKKCGGRPLSIALVEDAGRPYAAAPGWRIDLRPQA